MELSPKQQIIELIKSSQKILLLTHNDPDGDAISSIVAMKLILQKLGKDAVAGYSGLLAPNYSFLPVQEAARDLSFSKDFIINIDTAKTGIDKISYREGDETGGRLSLIITPINGRLSSTDVSFEEGRIKFDAIIILDSASLEMVGKIYKDNADVFEEAPIINIDHHITNTQYGKLNLIDTNATSTAEILVSLIEALGRDKNLLDPIIATCLLTGVIFDTDSFQNDNTTPKSFTVAAQLVAAGAKQQEIIQNIYMNKSLVVLKVWGRVLSNIVRESEGNFVWSKISQQDLKELGADNTATEGVNNELLRTVPNADFSLLLSEKEDGALSGSLRSINKDVNVTEVAHIFDGGGHAKAAGFRIEDKPFEEAVSRVIGKIRQSRGTQKPAFNKNNEQKAGIEEI